MYRMVNGQQIVCTPEEEAAFEAQWADNAPGSGAKWLADQAAQVAQQKTVAKDTFADTNASVEPAARWGRGLALVTMDELNDIREWTRDLKAAVAGAGTLAQLKTAIAALPTLNDRTASQIKPAIRDKIDAE